MKKIVSLLLCSSAFAFAGAQIKYIDKANMNTSVKPGDDFYQYANGGWLKTTVMPGTKTRWGSFNSAPLVPGSSLPMSVGDWLPTA